MIRQELEGLADAQNLLKPSLRVLGGDEVKESLKVGERTLGYFDGRHARALSARPPRLRQRKSYSAKRTPPLKPTMLGAAGWRPTCLEVPGTLCRRA